MNQPSLQDVFRARGRIAGIAERTPLIESPRLSRTLGSRVFVKLESLQRTGAFKVRGAANRILSFTAEQRQAGVITFSTGNHGKAVAYVAGRLGLPAVVCISEHVPAYRAERIRELGAEVVVKGHSQDEAEREYHRLISERNLQPVVPFDDPYVIAGQATIGLEMLEDEPELDTALVQLSGGGLGAGGGLALKEINPRLRLIGVSIERSPALLESLKAGRPVELEERDTVADSLLGGIGMDNRYTLQMVDRYFDEHIVVDEPEIELGMSYMLSEHSLVVEGAGTAAIGALLQRKITNLGNKVGVIASGSAVDLAQYLETMSRLLR